MQNIDKVDATRMVWPRARSTMPSPMAVLRITKANSPPPASNSALSRAGRQATRNRRARRKTTVAFNAVTPTAVATIGIGRAASSERSS